MKISFYKSLSFLLIGFVLFVFFLALKDDKRYNTEKIIGKEIDNFEIKFLSKDDTFSKKDLIEKKYYLINIWASWCLPCRKEHTFLMKLSESNNLQLIGINFKDKDTNAKTFLKELGDPFKISLSDNDGTKSIIFGAFGVPESILIDPEKIIVKKFIGPINNEDLSIILETVNDK